MPTASHEEKAFSRRTGGQEDRREKKIPE